MRNFGENSIAFSISNVALAIAIILGLAACNASPVIDLGDGNKDTISGTFESTGCKQADGAALKLKSGETDADTLANNIGRDSGDGLEGVSAVAYDSSVKIIHHNAVYQCDSKIDFKMDRDGDKIIITEIEQVDVVSDCRCAMDLSVDIDDLQEGRIYSIEVWDEYHDELFGALSVKVGECPDQCQTNEDCYKQMPEFDIDGSWLCIDGMCEFDHNNNNDMRCRSDYDCPSGYQCNWYYYDEVGGGIDVNNTRATTGGGQGYMECDSSRDCPKGMWCEMVDCMGQPNAESNTGSDDGYYGDSDCYGGGVCMGEEPVSPPEPEYGYCEPVNYECRSDYDCPNGYHCERYEYPDEPVTGDAEEGSDDSGSSASSIAPDGYGVCVADDNYCLDDSDCPAGYFCDYYDYDGEDYPTAPDGEGYATGGGSSNSSDSTEPYYEYGVCRTNYPNSCETMGGVCFDEDVVYDDGVYNKDSVCPDGWIPAYELFYIENACNTGVCCIEEEIKPECETDSDCNIYYNNVDEEYPPNGAPGPDGYYACISGFCEFVEQCFDYTCSVNADCPEGAVCEFYGDDCEGDGCCGGSRCVYVDEPCVCPEYYSPVCGTDGQTYSNECFAECARVKVSYYGECKRDYCYSSYDCKDFQVCTTDLGECSPPPDCAEGQDCDAVCTGVCVDTVESCESDSDCKPWQYCDFCPPYPGCPECDACGSPVCTDMPD